MQRESAFEGSTSACTTRSGRFPRLSVITLRVLLGKTAKTVPRKRLAGKLLAMDRATRTNWADHQANGVY